MSEMYDVGHRAKFLSVFSPDGGHRREHCAGEQDYGFCDLQGALLRLYKPRRVLCIGSRFGYVPAFMAWIAKCTGLDMHVDFVDANYDDYRDGFQVAWGGVGAWHDAMKRFLEFGLGQYITTYIYRTDEFFPRCAVQYDYVYFDGSHAYEGVKYDFEQALEHSPSNAVYVFHDVEVTEPGFGVKRFVRELEDEGWSCGYVYQWPGLAVVQRSRTVDNSIKDMDDAS